MASALEKPRRYLLLKGKAGLGNRMLVLLDSILYAAMTGRELVIDWRDGKYAAEGENAFPLLFESPAAGDLLAVAGAEPVTPAIWGGHLEESVDAFFARKFPDDPEIDTVARVAGQTTVDVCRPDDGSVVAVRWGWTHELTRLRPRFGGELERFRSMPIEGILRTVLREHVSPAADLRGAVAEFKRGHFGEKTIGVHVRFSDRRNAYDACYRHVRGFLGRHPEGTVFLATDNRAVEVDFKARFPRVAVTEKWFPPAGVPIHRNEHPERRPLQNAREALTDLYLLGACDWLVFNSTSTFGILAKLLSEAPREGLIDTAPVSLRPLVRRGMKSVRLVTRSIGAVLGRRGV